MQNAIPPTPEDDDDTVLVGRGDDETVIVSREETVIVPREETVIVPREETVIVIRGAAVPDDEDTISISTDRGSQSSARSPAPTSDAAPERSDAAPVSPEAQVDDEHRRRQPEREGGRTGGEQPAEDHGRGGSPER